MSAIHANQLIVQFEHAWEKLAWNVPFKTAIEGLNEQEAEWKPVESVNSIRQIVKHCLFYNERMLYRLRGLPIPERLKRETNTATFHADTDESGQAGWEAECARAIGIFEQIRAALAEATAEKLDESLGETTLGNELSLWVMHDAFHSGQIVLLRKQMGKWKSPYEA
ncbi:DinB family protein [Paenibacillus aurantiacus]|uniref:DinB family protein n=1 Tax=Paenibacillus aurantiacus TaxID=1936118 RepID=A0ABV5KTS2_9BACL